MPHYSFQSHTEVFVITRSKYKIKVELSRKTIPALQSPVINFHRISDRPRTHRAEIRLHTANCLCLEEIFSQLWFNQGTRRRQGKYVESLMLKAKRMQLTIVWLSNIVAKHFFAIVISRWINIIFERNPMDCELLYITRHINHTPLRQCALSPITLLPLLPCCARYWKPVTSYHF